MKLKDMSLAELKAAYDFIQIHLTEFEEKGRKANTNVKETSAYKDYA